MSSVDPLTPPVSTAGTDQVSAEALDAQIALIADTINRLAVAVGRTRDAANGLADGVALWRAFSDRCKQRISDIVDYLGSLYGMAETRWTDLPVQNGDWPLVGGEWHSGAPAVPPSTTWVFTMPGDPRATFQLILRARHMAPPFPVAVVRVTQAGSSAMVWTLNAAALGTPADVSIVAHVKGGDILTIEYQSGTTPQFSTNTDFLADDDADFPYRPRYRSIGAFQFDWMSFVPLPDAPPEPPTPPIEMARRLLENGSLRLLENGSTRLLEASP